MLFAGPLSILFLLSSCTPECPDLSGSYVSEGNGLAPTSFMKIEQISCRSVNVFLRELTQSQWKAEPSESYIPDGKVRSFTKYGTQYTQKVDFAHDQLRIELTADQQTSLVSYRKTPGGKIEWETLLGAGAQQEKVRLVYTPVKD